MLRIVGGEQGRTATTIRWGLPASWLPPGEVLRHARAETALTNPTFRDAASRRRYIVPVNSWFEWGTRPGAKRCDQARQDMHVWMTLEGTPNRPGVRRARRHLRESSDRGRTEPIGSKPEGKVPIAQSRQGATPRESPPAARDKSETAETLQKQPATKAVPLVIAAMRGPRRRLGPPERDREPRPGGQPRVRPSLLRMREAGRPAREDGSVRGQTERSAGPGAEEVAAIALNRWRPSRSPSDAR